MGKFPTSLREQFRKDWGKDMPTPDTSEVNEVAAEIAKRSRKAPETLVHHQDCNVLSKGTAAECNCNAAKFQTPDTTALNVINCPKCAKEVVLTKGNTIPRHSRCSRYGLITKKQLEKATTMPDNTNALIERLRTANQEYQSRAGELEWCFMDADACLLSDAAVALRTLTAEQDKARQVLWEVANENGERPSLLECVDATVTRRTELRSEIASLTAENEHLKSGIERERDKHDTKLAALTEQLEQAEQKRDENLEYFTGALREIADLHVELEKVNDAG